MVFIKELNKINYTWLFCYDIDYIVYYFILSNINNYNQAKYKISS